MVYLRKLMFLKTVVRELWKKICGRPVVLEELQTVRNFSKASLDFNKIPNTVRQVLRTCSELCVFCVLKNCPPEAVGED